MRLAIELLELPLEDRRLLTAPIEHRLGQLEVALLAGDARQLHERQLDALVSRDVVLLAGTELAVEEIGQPRRDREQRLLAGRLIVGDGGLEQVTGREVLVEEREVLEAQVGHVDLDEGVQIPVRLLGGGDAGDEAVHLRVERRIGMLRERPRRAFDPLVDVRIGPERAAELARRLAGGDVEVAEPARRLDLLQHVVERAGAIHLEARRPERIANRDGGHRQRRETVRRRTEIVRARRRSVTCVPSSTPSSHDGDPRNAQPTAGGDANRSHVSASR